MILITDMSKHFESLGTFRTRGLIQNDISIDKFEDRLFVLKMGLKCADLGHSAKTFKLHETWSDKVCQEFFLQGDKERSLGIPISMFCDREGANKAKSQYGFLTNIWYPLYDTFELYLNSDVIRHQCVN